MDRKTIVFIGLGGIAHSLFRPVMSLLAAHIGACQIKLVDHDIFEEKNRPRQPMCKPEEPKAEVVKRKLSDRYPQHEYQALQQRFVVEDAQEVFCENAVVFGCVDNHEARRAIAQAARKFDDLVTVVGANGVVDDDGNRCAVAFIYVRRNGNNLNPPYDYPRLHHDIADPESFPPEEREPQMTAENDLAASFMQLLLTHYLLTNEVCYDEMLCRPSVGEVVQKRWSEILPQEYLPKYSRQ